MSPHPRIVQGGMGVGVSSWELARTVAQLGQLGVVSGTAVAVTVARRLMDGDPNGHIRRALAAFPDQRIAADLLHRYRDRRGAKDVRPKYRTLPRYSLKPSRALVELTVAANFVEVYLAKEGHDGVIGVNYLEKVQLPTLPSLYGALLAGVDYIFMGAGIPAHIPALLDRLVLHQAVSMPIAVAGSEGASTGESHFDPSDVVEVSRDPLRRPDFIAIVSSLTLAKYLMANSSGTPDGFVVEGPTAGGHNAPPRGRMQLSEAGEPIYGPRDAVDPAAFTEFGVPFWLAGGYGDPAALEAALASGAAGVQVGTAFAFCEESGLDPALRREAVEAALRGSVPVRTDPLVSPTGYPFKVVEALDTLSDPLVYGSRPRLCDLGYLRETYRRPDGRVGYRCPAEPVEDYLAKGGDPDDTIGRACLCNGLLATVGLGQRRPDGYEEPALITAGDDVLGLSRFVRPGETTYTAADVVGHLLGSDPR
jgi:NAD(P)H-dependent flavin oxidoreductase YrpB (nitropropane dioxygenase family)